MAASFACSNTTDSRMFRYCLQPLRKWGSGTAQESPGCLHLLSLPSGFYFGTGPVFFLPPWRNVCLSGSTLTPLNHLRSEIRTSVKVQLIYKGDTEFSKLCSSCRCPDQVVFHTIPVPTAHQQECIGAGQGQPRQTLCPPCNPGQWAPLPGIGKSWLLQQRLQRCLLYLFAL